MPVRVAVPRFGHEVTGMLGRGQGPGAFKNLQNPGCGGRSCGKAGGLGCSRGRLNADRGARAIRARRYRTCGPRGSVVSRACAATPPGVGLPPLAYGSCLHFSKEKGFPSSQRVV